MALDHIKRVKIIGAGSIGNHLAHAARTLECEVVVSDANTEALERMRTQIYPARYGCWDPNIQLRHVSDVPIGNFDLICVGTPPDTHVPLALRALSEKPRALQIEKPLCTPDLAGASQLLRAVQGCTTEVFVGYDHVVGKATQKLEQLILNGAVGRVLTFDVEFREFWGGIFQAHPWLSGPEDSYLGFWQRGGGASGEHSHALNLWQHLSHALGFGRVTYVDAVVRYVRHGTAYYDDCCFWQLRTEHGMIGRVAQDVVTQPVRKVARIHGDAGTAEWINGYASGVDAVVLARAGREREVIEIAKTRPEDFIQELEHIDRHIDNAAASPISLQRGFETLVVVAAAHEAERIGGRVHVKYEFESGLGALDQRALP